MSDHPEARLIGGPLAGEDIELTYGRVAQLKLWESCFVGAVAMEKMGYYERLENVEPPVYLWMGWGR